MSIVSLLLAKGASIEARNAFGNSALALSASPACTAVLRQVAEGGQPARERLRAELEAAAAAARERAERERAEREQRCGRGRTGLGVPVRPGICSTLPSSVLAVLLAGA